MKGTLAQLIALASYGNAYLATGYLPDDFYPSNTTFQFCRTVEFIEFKKTSFLSKRKDSVVAETPKDWFAMLKGSECKKLRLYFQYSQSPHFAQDHKLAGMVGGGGKWLIEAIFKNNSQHWTNRWEVKDQKAEDRKIWKVSCRLTSAFAGIIRVNDDLDGLKELIGQTLTRIAEFAFQQKCWGWADQFDKAKAILSSTCPNEHYYHKDLIVIRNYSLTAQQVLFAACNACVFGGMGSWNDIVFDNKEDEKKYDELSAVLYDNIIQAVLASVNSY